MSNILYIKIEKNNEVSDTRVTLGDVAALKCMDKAILSKVKTIKLLSVPDINKRRYAFSIMNVIELINREFPDLEINNIGETDFIIDYIKETEKKRKINRAVNVIKVGMICLITFFGSAFAIMAYNNDIGVSEVFQKAYKIFLNEEGKDAGFMEVMYSIGLTVGIIIFYNHFAGKKITSDPTPLEVEMYLYENDIDDALINRSSRTKEEGKVL